MVLIWRYVRCNCGERGPLQRKLAASMPRKLKYLHTHESYRQDFQSTKRSTEVGFRYPRRTARHLDSGFHWCLRTAQGCRVEGFLCTCAMTYFLPFGVSSLPWRLQIAMVGACYIPPRFSQEELVGTKWLGTFKFMRCGTRQGTESTYRIQEVPCIMGLLALPLPCTSLQYSLGIWLPQP